MGMKYWKRYDRKYKMGNIKKIYYFIRSKSRKLGNPFNRKTANDFFLQGMNERETNKIFDKKHSIQLRLFPLETVFSGIPTSKRKSMEKYKKVSSRRGYQNITAGAFF